MYKNTLNLVSAIVPIGFTFASMEGCEAKHRPDTMSSLVETTILRQLSIFLHIYGTAFDRPVWVDLFRRSTKCLGWCNVALMYWVYLMLGRPFAGSTFCPVDLLLGQPFVRSIFCWVDLLSGRPFVGLTFCRVNLLLGRRCVGSKFCLSTVWNRLGDEWVASMLLFQTVNS